MKFLNKFKLGLKRTRELTLSKIVDLIRHGRIDEDMLETLEEALLEADVGVDSTDELVAKIRELITNDKTSTAGEPLDILRSEMVRILDGSGRNNAQDLNAKPWVIILVGVNGSGKTTTAGKLAWMFAQEGRTCAIAAADTFRAAAIEQIEIWAERCGARLIKQGRGADPAAVTFDAYQSACARGEDILIVDTAGRLQGKHNLMQELGKITRILKKFDAGAPHEVMLILDATTGQNGLSQAKGFAASAGVTSLVVTKLDGSAKGGFIIPVVREMGLPIKYIGMGERVEDLYPFEPDSYVEALLSA